jgi:hypothetical protein
MNKYTPAIFTQLDKLESEPWTIIAMIIHLDSDFRKLGMVCVKTTHGIHMRTVSLLD